MLSQVAMLSCYDNIITCQPSNHLTDILSYVAMVIIIVYLTEMLNLMLFLRLNVFAIWELMVIKSCTTCGSHG